MADRGGARVRLLAFFTVIGVAMTAGLYFVGARATGLRRRSSVSLAGVGFWGGIIFYDSLLVDVAEPPEYDLVSAFGYALGYLGGGLLLAAQRRDGRGIPRASGLPGPPHAVRLAFVMVGVWWLSSPCPACCSSARRSPARPLRPAAAARAGWRELLATLRQLRKYRALVWFLLAYWLYIDGVNTVIKMAVDYGLVAGLPQQSLIVALLITQFVGFPGGARLRLAGRAASARAAASSSPSPSTPPRPSRPTGCDKSREFYVLAVVIGLVQGGIQSLSPLVSTRAWSRRASKASSSASTT